MVGSVCIGGRVVTAALRGRLLALVRDSWRNQPPLFSRCLSSPTLCRPVSSCVPVFVSLSLSVSLVFVSLSLSVSLALCLSAPSSGLKTRDEGAVPYISGRALPLMRSTLQVRSKVHSEVDS